MLYKGFQSPTLERKKCVWGDWKNTPFPNTAGKQIFALNGISILSCNKQLLALGHARLQQSASVPGTGLWPRGLNLSGLFEPDNQEVGEAGERRGEGFLKEQPGES